MTGPHFGMIPRWLAPLDLTGRELRVLLVIACHAGKASREPRPHGVIETRIAQIGSERIADEANLDRRNVQRVIRQLEAKGILEGLHGGGRGRTSEYRIIFKQAAYATNSVDDDAVCGAEDAGNSVVFSQETASFSDQNSVTCDAHTESEQKERTDPPSGESRARGEEDFSNDWVNEKQGVLLTPINGGGDRMAPLRRYNPSAELLDWASESYSINALDERVLGEFIDWHIEHDNLPGNIGAIEAAYRRWIRREARFAGQSRHRPQQHSNAAEAEAEAAVEAVRRMRAMRANGAGND
jgi:DNA-binding MarR family transcriptional regulator